MISRKKAAKPKINTTKNSKIQIRISIKYKKENRTRLENVNGL
jgi:hypothetical protein